MAINETNKSLSPAIIVMDFDDVLAPLSIGLYHNIRKNWRIYSRWFVDLGELSDKEIMDRKFYSMIEWMVKKKFINLTSKEYSALILEVREMFNQTFFNKDPYEGMEPTEFAKKTLLNPLYIESDNIKHVYIVSRNVSEMQDISKRRFIEEHFTNPKISYISVERLQKKSDIIKENNINFNMFIDDELPNIRDIVENISDIERKEFVIPKYGYNVMQEDLEVIIEAAGAVVNYYDPFKE